jgi:hypothetical protein
MNKLVHLLGFHAYINEMHGSRRRKKKKKKKMGVMLVSWEL